MKKILFPILLMLAVVSACSKGPKQPDGGYLITGNITGLKDSMVTLNRPAGRQLMPIDTAEIIDGKFYFSGKAAEDEIVYIQIGTGFNYVELFLENEKIEITGTMEKLMEAQVVGGPNNKVWGEFKKMNLDFTKASESLSQKYATADATQKAAIEKEYMDGQKVFIDKILGVVKENSKATAGLFLIQNVLRPQLSFEQLSAAVNSLDASLAEKPAYKELKAELTSMESVQIGKKAPNFTMNDVQGKPVQMSSLLGKGYLLIDFWAGWCKPCRAENPNVVAAYAKYHSKGFDILGVSLDQEKKSWTDAIAQDNLSWTQVSDLAYWDNAAAKMYAVKSIPHNVLLDKDGVIVATNLRGEELTKKLDELLAGK